MTPYCSLLVNVKHLRQAAQLNQPDAVGIKIERTNFYENDETTAFIIVCALTLTRSSAYAHSRPSMAAEADLINAEVIYCREIWTQAFTSL